MGDLKTQIKKFEWHKILFPLVKTTSFRFRMFCPVFRKVILEESSERDELTERETVLLHWQQSDILIKKFTEKLFILLISIFNFLMEIKSKE